MMKWFYNLRIAAKPLAEFLTTALLSRLIGDIGIFALSCVNGSCRTAYTESLAAVYGDYESNN